MLPLRVTDYSNIDINLDIALVVLVYDDTLTRMRTLPKGVMDTPRATPEKVSAAYLGAAALHGADGVGGVFR